jgi:transposase InsO family protein
VSDHGVLPAKKNNDYRRLLLGQLQAMKAQTQCSWERVCPPLARSTVMRWLKRQRAGEPLWCKPGPKKSVSGDWPALLQDLQRLRPGRCRIRGTGLLYRRYARWLSRRELTHLAREFRQNQLHSMKHLQWLKTGLVWSIDATEYGPDGTLIVPVQDLASRYRFPAMAANRINGPAVAAHLDRLFQEFGPPLFLKRDNGSPFNHHAVDELLGRYCVLPLNNPPHFPRYNGAMERGISELKHCLNARWPAAAGQHLSAALENAFHHLNHKSRRSLDGQTACARFHDPRHRLRLTKRQRRELFRLLCREFWQRVKNMTPRNQHDYATQWRRTVEAWLRCQGLISIRLNKKVSTILPNFLSHN